MAQYQETASEKASINQKRSELDTLRARHEEERASLQRLREQVIDFEKEYDERLGRRMAELEEVEAEIRLLGGSWRHEEGWDEQVAPAAAPKAGSWRSDTRDIKSLYREVAKSVHPDLVGSGAGGMNRNELMTQANRAYANNDRRTLQEILRNWREVQPSGPGDEAARLDRRIAEERQALRVTCAKVEELRNSFACRFNLKSGCDHAAATLLAEMVQAVELNIDRAYAQLSELRLARRNERRERQASEQAQRPQPNRGKRDLLFPEQSSCGVLYVRDRVSLNFTQWQRAGIAKGRVQVYADQAVRLDVKVQAGTLDHLRLLGRDDLQALFLYNACDIDMFSIAHLTGLEELYLSGLALTDAALRCISPLTNLKRIYIYQTSISDLGLSYLQHFPRLDALTSSGNRITEGGLAGLQLAVPRVKTTSFQWKR